MTHSSSGNSGIQLHRVGIVLALTTLSGCAATMPVAPHPEPTVIVPEGSTPIEGSAPIAFTRLVVRIPSGTDIGAHHDGLFQIPMFRYTWQSNISVASDEFKVVASEHLKSKGYTVMGGDNLLFGTDESSKAEYQLGGTARSLRYNTYGRLAGDYSECFLEIEWQLYDLLEREIVYCDTTSGYGRQYGVGSACIQMAFRAALDYLLANSGFVAQVKKSPHDAWVEKPESLTTIDITACSTERSFHLPESLNSVLECVLLIQTGGSVGSGVLISHDGWAITAAHVVAGLENVNVRLRSGLELTATVVRVDRQQDVALIRLPGRRYTCAPVATAGMPEVGSDVFAVGAPAGEELAFSVTKGIISGVRESRGLHYLQTDAALNPGNSGGPLISAEGSIIGIVSWKIVGQGFEGLAFGVPIQTLADRLGISWK